jgi:hypothetical protein
VHVGFSDESFREAPRTADDKQVRASDPASHAAREKTDFVGCHTRSTVYDHGLIPARTGLPGHGLLGHLSNT